MAKLTKAQRQQLEAISGDLTRGIKYLQEASIAVCRRVANPTTTLDFTRQPIADVLKGEADRMFGHYALTEVNKHIGSEIIGLYTAQRALKALLAEQEGA
jgi:hypothetical protein